jgi:tetratricopeptide (TPR) repeat protein
MPGLQEKFRHKPNNIRESVVNINQLEQKLAQRPLSPLFARLAHEYLSVDRIDDAMNLLLKGIGTYTEYSTAFFALAECYIHEQSLKAALDAINHAVHMNPAIETLQQVRKEIQSLYDGSSIMVGETSQSPEINPTVDESDALTSTEVTVIMPDQTQIEQSALAKDRIADISQVETTPTDILNGQETEISAEPSQVSRGDEATISQQLSELLQETEQDNLFLIPGEKTGLPEQDALITKETETTEELTQAISEETPVIEQSPSLDEEIQLPPEHTTPVAGEDIILPSDNPLQGEQPADVQEIESDILKEGYQGRTDEETILDQVGEASDILNPPVEENLDFTSDEEISKATQENVIAESVVQSSETTDTPVESQPGIEPQLPEDDYRIVSKTLAEIYASQGEYGEALMIYRLLKHQRPDLEEIIDKRIEELERLLRNDPQTPH